MQSVDVRGNLLELGGGGGARECTVQVSDCREPSSKVTILLFTNSVVKILQRIATELITTLQSRRDQL